MEEHMKIAMLFCTMFICISGLMALTGYGTTTQVINDTCDPFLSILAPNGGETWYIGDTHDITWAATDNNILSSSINIWYSLNGGTEYTSIIENTSNDGIHPWLLPSVNSYDAKVRIDVSDSFGNSTQIASADHFHITSVPPMPPTGVMVSIVNEEDAIITWQSVTQDIHNIPMNPDGYIVLYNETPYDDDQYFNLLGVTQDLYITHHLVTGFGDRMFYKVISFKDYRNSLANIIRLAIENPELKLSLAEIKAALHNHNVGDEK